MPHMLPTLYMLQRESVGMCMHAQVYRVGIGKKKKKSRILFELLYLLVI